MKSKKIYMDFAASTPVAQEAMDKMQPYFREQYGNPGSLHSFGQEALLAIDEARQVISAEIGADFEEVIFTSSATEANDLIVDGLFFGSVFKSPKIIISALEHDSIEQTAKALVDLGARVTVVPVTPEGIIDTEALVDALDEETVLVSIVHASNEIGVIQPIEEIGAMIGAFRRERGLRYPLFHTDAAQTPPFMKIDVDTLGVDALTLSSHKIYGPKGAGLLYLNKEYISQVKPQLLGGGYEFGLRASTPNTPAIVGFGAALNLMSQNRAQEADRIKTFRDRLLDGLKEIEPALELNGSLEGRLPGNLNICFPGRAQDNLVMRFDMEGVALSAGSACSARAQKVSRAILALGHSEERARSSIRISLGRTTTQEDIEGVLAVARKVLKT